MVQTGFKFSKENSKGDHVEMFISSDDEESIKKSFEAVQNDPKAKIITELGIVN